VQQRIRTVDPALHLYGSLVDITVSLPSGVPRALVLEDSAVVDTLAMRAMLDTGANCCGIRKGTADKLGLQPVNTTWVRRGGRLSDAQCYQYLMLLAILGPDGSPVFEQELVFVEDEIGTDEYQALIGLPVLQQAIFVLHGPRRFFSLRFPD
jgi:hypothetical protein